MTQTSRLITILALAFAPLALACDVDNPFDNSCPAGYWRPRAMAGCEPLPGPHAGQDSGTPPSDAGTDAGPADGGAAMDGAVDDAGSDAAGSVDAGADDASAPDAAADGG